MQEFFITAVDIGTHKISASLGVSRKGEEVEILGSSCVNVRGVENGVIVGVDKCRNYFEETLSKLEEQTRKKISEIYIGLPSNVTEVTSVQARIDVKGKVTTKDIKKILDKVEEKVVAKPDYEVCNVCVNYYVLDGVESLDSVLGKSGNKLEVNLLVLEARKEILDTYRKLCKETKYTIKGYFSNVISLRKIFLNEQILEEKVAIVEIGSSLTEIAIFENKEAIESVALNIGGKNITDDLSICMALPIYEAEYIKLQMSPIYKRCLVNESKALKIRDKEIDKELFYKVCEARIEEILNYVKNELKKASHYDEICSIILCGDAITNFEGVKEVIHHEFKDKKVMLVTKNDFGMQNISNITSLAIVKEVHDKVELIYEESLSFTREFEVQKLEENAYKSEKEEIQKGENKSIIRKLKSFLGDMF